MSGSHQQTAAAETFRRSLRILIGVTWAIPPVFGLGFLVAVVEMFDMRQLGQMMLAPPLPLYVVGALVGTDYYFRRFSGPIVDYLQEPSPAKEVQALARAKRFQVDFWILFLAYLVLAPVAVMASANLAYGFSPQPIDWFRIELVSLVVSIIVGLPIFFLVQDLFGRTFRDAKLDRPHVKIEAKVFLIGALVPLLIDTMLVQYYWTETGYFTFETFVVWLVLELLAIAGALMFVRSFRQSLEPLAQAMTLDREHPVENPSRLRPQSTDELGVLAHGYKELLGGLEAHNRTLQLKNEMFRRLEGRPTHEEVVATVLDLATRAVDADEAFLAIHDPESDEMVIVARSNGGYRAKGFSRTSRGTVSMLWIAFESEGTQFTSDAKSDPRADVRAASELGHRAGLFAPLVVDEIRLGVLVAAYEEPRKRPDPSAQALFADLAREASSRLHSAMLRRDRERLEHELQKAQRLEGVGLLAGGIAHDFNNILTSIFACASMLREDLRDHPSQDEADEILSSAERAAVLTRQLLAFSRRQVLEPEVMDLNGALDDLSKMLARLLPSRIEFERELAKDLWRIRADRAQIEQVILNLVVNARDAVDTHGRIVLRTFNSDAESVPDAPAGEWVCLQVSDDGVGVQPELQDRIFEPYFTTKESGGGSGLGLATVFGIVSQSGGHVRLDSKPGEGSTFTIMLPRTVDPIAEPKTESFAPRLRRGPCTVLVTEDDEHVRKTVAGILRNGGYRVVQADRGPKALELLESESRIDLLLTDVVMPEMTGVELARRIRELRPGITVLLMSGYADDDVLDEIVSSGLPFVPKPFTAQTLTDRVAEALARAEAVG